MPIIDKLNSLKPSITGMTLRGVYQALGELFNTHNLYNRNIPWGGKAKGQGSVPQNYNNESIKPTVKGLQNN